MIHGYGVLYNESPVYITSCVDYKELGKITSCWVKYEGYFQNDKREGQGTLYLTNGEQFRGNFVEDMPQGPGIYKDINGKHIQGNWDKGILIGQTQKQK